MRRGSRGNAVPNDEMSHDDEVSAGAAALLVLTQTHKANNQRLFKARPPCWFIRHLLVCFVVLSMPCPCSTQSSLYPSLNPCTMQSSITRMLCSSLTSVVSLNHTTHNLHLKNLLDHDGPHRPTGHRAARRRMEGRSDVPSEGDRRVHLSLNGLRDACTYRVMSCQGVGRARIF